MSTLFVYHKIMTTINDAYKKVIALKSPAMVNVDRELFGLQEAVTKLWTAVMLKKGKDEIGKRVSNVLIGTFINAHRLGIKDVESVFDKRLVEFRSELKSSSKSR